MDSSFFLGTFVGAAVVFFFFCYWFTLYSKIRFQRGNKKIDAPSSPPSPSPTPSSLSPSSSSSSLSPPSSSSSSSLSSVPSSSSHNMTRSESSNSCAHDVFPSFHGQDVRKTFLSHTLKEFKRKGISTFIDNDMERSKSIGPELINAIRGSRISIVMLSKNYASSSWCLNELVEILNCRRKLGQIVMTIFNEVEPTDVKKQTGDFGDAFKNTCVGRKKEETERWRQALAEVATIAGEHSSKWSDEATMIEHFVTDVSNKLNNSTSTSDFYGLIGMKAHLEAMDELLRLDSDEVRMVGILGPPGIGKTTIARVAHNHFSSSFQYSVFMENIDASMYTRPCSDDYSAKLLLQQQLVSKIFQKDIKIPHLGVAPDRLKNKKVLIVLDGVDHSMQLEAMAKETRWFGRGSRIIIATEDQKILKGHAIEHIYKVDFPPVDEALQIFCMNAFRQSFPYEGFEKLAWEATNLAGKLPLGLRVFGSYFREMSKQSWKEALPMLRTRLDGEIASILKLGYDALHKEDKELFLYIACFFNNESIGKVKVNLANEFLDVRQGLDILVDKSLISIEANKIKMHNLVVQLGKEISRSHEHGQRQILVDQRDIIEVLTSDRDNGNVIGMNFNLSELSRDITINERAFEGLFNLQFLRVHYPIGARRNLLHLPQGLNSLPRRTRVLHWDNFPGTCLPSGFNPESLVELNMRESKLEKLWEGTQRLENLRWVNLSYSENLKEIPDLSTAINLVSLVLNNCTSLMELPLSIGNAKNIRELVLVHCSSLVKLPSSIGKLTSLRNLDLSNCSSLVELPSSIENLVYVEKVDLSYCSSLVELPCSMGNLNNLIDMDLKHCSSLVKLPPFIGNATGLQKLDLSHCSSIVELPSIRNATNLLHLNLNGCSSLVELSSSIGNAANLKKMYLNNCSSLVKLPCSIGGASNLEKLELSNCSSLVELPSSIGSVTHLLHLNLLGCSRLVKLPSSIGNLTNLKTLYLNNCSALVELPSSIGNASSLEKLDLSNCSSLVELPSSIGNATNLRKLKLVNCSSLVQLPSSIGNLYKLQLLSLKGCSKLKVLPVSVNMVSLHELDLSDCSSLKSFPEISANIGVLKLNGTAIKEVSSSMQSWYRLSKFQMSYCESLKDFPYALNRITELHLSDTEIKEVQPWVIEISNLRRFVLNGCRKLVSIPQLSDSLSSLHAANCESLEKLDCFFHNPQIRLNFVNCFNLNKESRARIIYTPTRRHAILPGGEVPAYFTYQATGCSLLVKLNERPLPISLRFKACILLFIKGDDDNGDDERSMSFYIRIMDKQNGLAVPYKCRDHSLPPPLTDHLYTFEIEAEVTSTELHFVFDVHLDNWEIGKCGVFELMEVPRVREHDASSDSDTGGKH